MKKWRLRAVSLLLTVVMLFSVLPTMALAAAPTITMRVSTPSGVPGSTVQVKIDLEGNNGIGAVRMLAAYDPALTLTSIEYNKDIDGKPQPPQTYKSPVRLVWISGTTDYTGPDANFAVLTFQISETAERNRTYPITITYDPNDIYSIENGNLDVNLIEGGVKVLPCVPGDINGDAVCNMRDVTCLFQYFADWNVTVNEAALDTTGDGAVNMRDLTHLFQYMADWDVELHCGGVTSSKCDHTMEYHAYVAPTCTEAGETAHWHCTKCGKNYSDENGITELQDSALTVKALGHDEVEIPAVQPTTEKVGYTAGKKCARCGLVLEAPVEIPKLELTEYNIVYDLYDNDPYLQGAGVKNPNPAKYSSEQGLTLKPLIVPGYRFLGWYNGYNEPVREIPKGTTGEVYLSARWEVSGGYTIHFVYKGKPIAVEVDGEEVTSAHKNANELFILPEPKMQGYIFMCWTDRENNIVTSIDPGSVGQKTVFAHFTSVRNQAVPKPTLGKPLIYEDVERGQILFTYEIGKMINVPLAVLASYPNQLDKGPVWESETTKSYTVNKSQAEVVADSIANTTAFSSEWTLSDTWSKAVTCDETHQEGITEEEAKIIKDRVAQGEQYNISKENGGSSAFSKTSGSGSSSTEGKTTAKLEEFSGSDDHHISNTDNGEFKTGIAGKVTNNTTVKASAEVGAKYGPLSAKAGVEATNSTGFEVSSHADYAHDWHSSQEDNWSSAFHNSESLGTANTKVDNSYSNQTTNDEVNWNKQIGYEKSKEISNEKEVSNALSKMIEDTYGYSSTVGEDKSSSKTAADTISNTQKRETSTTVEYATEVRTIERTSITNQGAAAGWYRVVEAGIVHVFAVVGFDIATGSYYTYSYNVVDDQERYVFLDYSLDDPEFKDRENGVLPFEVPEEVHEIVSDIMMRTEGLTINNTTGIVEEYSGTSQAVVIPDYVTVDRGGTPVSVQVTGIEAKAFKGNPNVKAIKLSRYIENIPDHAFEGCTGLETLVAPGMKTIGANAFAGCTSLKEFALNTQITKLGNQAFLDVNNLIAVAANTDVAQAVMQSGAKHVTLSVAKMTDAFTAGESLRVLEVPESTTYFAMRGDAKNKTVLENTQLISHAEETVLNNLSFQTNGAVVLKLYSPKVELGFTDVTTDAIAMLLDHADTDVRVWEISNLTSTGSCAVLTRNASYRGVGTGVVNRINVTGEILVSGTHSDPAGVVKGSVRTITEEEYNSILSTHKISFDAAGGSVTPSEMNAAFGKPYGPLPTPVREHYVFDGWYTAAEGGTEITAETVCNSVGNTTVYAHWTLRPYTLQYNAIEGVNVSVSRTASPNGKAGTGELSNGAVIYYGDVLRISYTAKEGYNVASHGAEEHQVAGNVGNDIIQAQGAVKQYAVAWNNPANGWISVNRTASPLKKAATGNLGSGSAIYYGDTLTVSYGANNGYSLSSHGGSSFNVTGNIGGESIYANAAPNNYTYTILYRSTNGTDLGSSTATHAFGSTHSISAPAKDGYDTPGAQNVRWDATNGKTITFSYAPSYVGPTTVVGNVSALVPGKQPGISYSCYVEFANRTATSIDFRVIATNTIAAGSHTVYGQKMVVTVGGVSTGEVEIAPFNAWKNQVNYNRDSTGTSRWFTVQLNTTNATRLNASGYFYQTNYNNTDMCKHYGAPGDNTSWTPKIPAY